MKKTTKTTENENGTKTLTRAEKKDAAKGLIKELLQSGEKKSTELIDEAAKVFAMRFQGEENENPNDVKGRIGSVLDVMKKEGEVQFDGGIYALKPLSAPVAEEKSVQKQAETNAEKPVSKKRATPKKATKKEEVKTQETAVETVAEETKPTPKKRTASKKTTVKKETAQAEQTQEQPQAQAEQPIVAEEKQTEKVAPKKRGRKGKTEVNTENKTEEKTENKETSVAEALPQEQPVVLEEKQAETPVEKEEIAEVKQAETPQEEKAEKEKSPQGTLMDMSFLLGNIKPQKPTKSEEKTGEKTEEKPVQKQAETKAEKSQANAEKEEKAGGQVSVERENPVQKPAQKPAQKPVQKQETQAQKTEQKQEQKTAVKPTTKLVVKPAQKPMRIVKTQTADEKLQEAFLNRLHRLGGEYFEYYSVYLLEKYSRMNGRRLEGLKISAGDRDGGIDGEIELTDKLGFRETIYIQAKNWDPSKGDEKLWVVGETLLQQFIGACVCRQAKDGKQHCRGIFITTSRFTPDAKKILNDTSDKFVGYDGTDLYETAKECGFGIIKKNGEWALDEELLSGVKAFYTMS
jgi:hypothetical protein